MTSEHCPITTVRQIASDREKALKSKQFRKWLYDTYYVKLYFLRTRSKAYLAERAVKYLKSRCNVSMKFNKKFRWVDYLAAITSEYNSKVIKGTKFKRSEVNQNNFHEFMKQRWGKHYNERRTHASIDGRSLGELADKIFKFKLRQKVLLSQRLDKSRVFNKTTTEGYYDPTVYYVIRRMLKTTRSGIYVQGIPIQMV